MDINQGNLDALFQGFNTAFRQGVGMAPSQYEQIAMPVTSTTSANIYPWLGDLPSMREWVGDRVINGLKLHDYTIKNRDFEKTVAVKQTLIEDDQYGVYAPMFADLGHEATAHPNRLVFDQLKNGHVRVCFDGTPFFSAAHPVGEVTASNFIEPGSGAGDPWYLLCVGRPIRPIIFQKRKDYNLTRMDRPTDENVFMRKEFLYGVDARASVGYGLWQLAVRSTEKLTSDAYAKARALMGGYRNDAGDPLGLVPDTLIVPASLEAAGRKVITAATGANGATNEWAGSATLLVSPWL